MYFVYILQSLKTFKYDIGSTNNVERRIQEHSSNKTASLKNKGPFKLVYTEEYPTLLEARQRELQIKAYKGGNAFKKLVMAHVQR